MAIGCFLDPAMTEEVLQTLVSHVGAEGVTVDGQATMYFTDTTARDAFFNETEIDLMAAFTADNTATADFLTVVLPRIKLGGARKAPADGGLVMTLPFQALLNSTGGAGVKTEKTTISMQDSQA